MISKELLNKNRVLTMSNNRKCDYLIVTTRATAAIMIGINTQGNTKDILMIKTFTDKTSDELSEEACWLCKEFDIRIVLVDRSGFGIGFINPLKKLVPDKVLLREVDIYSEESKLLYQHAYFHIEKDLESGFLRFLQSPELAHNSYIKPFLGYSNIMESHNETSKLINEISNIGIDTRNGIAKINRMNDTIGNLRVKCLFIYYSYPMSLIKPNNKKEQYYTTKRMSQYYIAYGTFYKYMFKCIENENLKVLFYCEISNKFQQFKNMCDEQVFLNTFSEYINKIISSKDNVEVRFNNGSIIKFVCAGDSARGHRYHYAAVDTNINRDIFYNTIKPKGILNEINNIDFIEM